MTLLRRGKGGVENQEKISTEKQWQSSYCWSFGNAGFLTPRALLSWTPGSQPRGQSTAASWAAGHVLHCNRSTPIRLSWENAVNSCLFSSPLLHAHRAVISQEILQIDFTQYIYSSFHSKWLLLRTLLFWRISKGLLKLENNLTLGMSC